MAVVPAFLLFTGLLLGIDAIRLQNKTENTTARTIEENGTSSLLEEEAHKRIERITKEIFDGITTEELERVEDGLKINHTNGSYSTCYHFKRTGPIPKLTMLTLVTDIPTAYRTGLRANRLRMADRYKYEYCEYSHSLDHPLAAQWSKIVAVRTLLQHQRPKVAWIDADALIMNFDKSFESLTDEYFNLPEPKQIDAVFTNQFDGHKINTGVFVTRDSEWSRQFWAMVYMDHEETHWNPGAILRYRDAYKNEFDAHAVIVKHTVLQSHFRPGGIQPNDYVEGDFILHVSGGNVGWGPCGNRWECMVQAFMGPDTTCCSRTW